MFRSLVRLGLSLVVVAAAGTGTRAAGAQEAPAGSRLRSTAPEVGLGGRVQTQFNTSTVDSVADSELLLRRVRLETQVRMNRVVSGRIQGEFAGPSAVVQDAFVRFDFHPAFQLLAGRANRPFSLIQLTSSTRMPSIERGVRIRGVEGLDHFEIINGLRYSDRDLGLQLSGAPAGAPLGLTYAAGVFAGPLHRRLGPEDSYQFAARGTIAPLEGVRIGAGWSNRHFARAVGTPAQEIRRGSAFEVDVEYGAFAPGLHLVGELAWGDFDPFAGDRFRGAQGWLAYRTQPLSEVLSALEPMVRVSYGDVDRDAGIVDRRGGIMLTPGFSVYFGPLNRIMVNYDHWTPAGDGPSEGSLKAQFQVAF